ncbi:glycoside hydrolase family 3 C-terminal domain-containing protein [Novosphingobium profundi]|uniref:glycoside hydrolase family 3 protein n=1 Tax=Novosphingobium profundi TaxID=1774954 RepID=UPI001BDA3C84|nr:glycoside hydrolase family 3 protein [Novosphingobium profundi]MBT0667909.1 glycoside hydrolase family 3 C-terminal domain-containing protein [Novosphingobium profundi]
MRRFHRIAQGLALGSCAVLALAQPTLAKPEAAKAPAATPVHPDKWPAAKSPDFIDPAIEARITDLLARMTLREKVGQMIQADTAAITPEDLREYPLGSILAGGNSPPIGAPDRSNAQPWIATSEAFNAVAMEQRKGHVAIPIIFGIDAVHGNSNVVGATLFPHNSGLGAMHDPALMREIGRATAAETAASGIHWAFGPTLAVPQDGRWGRAYEGYSEDPAVVAAYAGPMVEGLQGAPGTANTVQTGHVSASVKHFLGDGGTTDGIDQGDTRVDEDTLIAVHDAGYPAAVDAGTMTVMASFSSWNGIKMHGNKALLTDVLKGRMGFDGFVVGDWNGHGQIPGCTNTDCPATFNAGLDMAMAPDSWKGLFEATLREAKNGTIPKARIDDAVRRILRVKFKLGLFDPARPYEAQWQKVMGAPEHRAIARQAVRESLVLLKNEGVLPIKTSAKVLVAGQAADDIGRQSGGWTLSWQGDGNTNADFPGATSIFAGIRDALKAGGGTATLSVDGSFTAKPDVAVVVFGEEPYAELRGDVRTLEFQPGDKQALALLKKLKAQGIPTVSVFLSGRPLWVNPEMNQSDAFVAAWYPGSEGEGIADVLVGGKTDFHGTLAFSWPKTAAQFRLNKGEPGYDPLFPLGYGLTYAKAGHVGALGEEPGIDASATNTSRFITKGILDKPFTLETEAGVSTRLVDSADRQEGAIRLDWTSAAKARIKGPNLSLEREANADMNVEVTYRLDAAPKGPVTLALGSGAVRIDGALAEAGTWAKLKISLKCFGDHGTYLGGITPPFTLSAAAPFAVSISDMQIATDPAGTVCPK